MSAQKVYCGNILS